MVAVSTLFVAASVATFDTFTSFVSGLEFRAGSSSIARLASQAAAEGSATGSVALPASAISCSDGVMQMTSGGQTETDVVGGSCDFALAVPAGTHAFGFRCVAGQLSLMVS